MTLQHDEHRDEVDMVVADARARFEREFSVACARMNDLLTEPAATDALVHLLHRMAGLGGSIGFSRVSEQAREFEDVLRDGSPQAVDWSAARHRLDAIRRAFDEDRMA
jgi:HPt (histidine-containing phosphotransfer) domain-containing protein